MKASRILLLMAAIVLASIIIVAAYPSTTDFSIYNPWWNGYSEMRRVLGAHVIEFSLEDFLRTTSTNITLITVPYTRFSAGELEALKTFVSKGGRLVVMDDFGYGNQVLEYLGVQARFTNDSMLADPVFNYRNCRLPIVRNVDYPNVSEVVLNHASTILLMEVARIIANSSSYSYLDANFNGVWDEGESVGPFPVAVELDYGNGSIVLVSDPSIGINGMIGMGDNLEFIKSITGGRRVVIDESHVPGSMHDEVKKTVFTVRSMLSREYVFPFIVVGLIYVSLRKLWKG